jgi:uncharacterized protein YjaG (DUF416 family)
MKKSRRSAIRQNRTKRRHKIRAVAETLTARAEFKKRMEELGAAVVTDDMANIYATVPARKTCRQS